MSRVSLRREPFPSGSSRQVVSPIAPSVVYASESPDALDAQYDGTVPGYVYAREGHPNADRLAAMIDELEGAEGGLVTGSGMAAITAVLMSALNAGDHVIGGEQLYGRTLRLIADDLPRFGISGSLVDTGDIEAVRAAVRPETRLIMVEVVANPSLRVADVAGIARLTKERGILLAIDNTFTTPRAFTPLAQGADIVIHSVTKILAGHSDATLGYVAVHDRDLRERIEGFAMTAGLTPSPFDCWLAERGLYTFELRYDRAESTAAKLAAALSDAPGVRRVIYPMQADHPDSERAHALLGNRGSHIVSFEISGGRGAANALVRAAQRIAFAPTLGDVRTTLSHPASSSHRALSAERRGELGIGEGFFRASVGCEDADELIGEFLSAIAASQVSI